VTYFLEDNPATKIKTNKNNKNTMNVRTMSVSYDDSSTLGVFRDTFGDIRLPDNNKEGALLIDDRQVSVCSVTKTTGWSGSCMSDNTQQLLPPPENVAPNTVVQIQNKIFIDNFGFVDNQICKEPIDFDIGTNKVTFSGGGSNC
jgi:hypothetical protein